MMSLLAPTDSNYAFNRNLHNCHLYQNSPYLLPSLTQSKSFKQMMMANILYISFISTDNTIITRLDLFYRILFVEQCNETLPIQFLHEYCKNTLLDHVTDIVGTHHRLQFVADTSDKCSHLSRRMRRFTRLDELCGRIL